MTYILRNLSFLLLMGFCCGCQENQQPTESIGEEEIATDSTHKVPTVREEVLKYDEWIDFSDEGISIDQQGKIYPVDQAELNSDFLNFRNELLAAIDRNDVAFLLDHVDESIKMSYGIEHGKADFISSWSLDKDPKNSRIWKPLKSLLLLGGIFDDEHLQSFTAPYTFFADVPDPYDYFIITGTQVRIRNKPSLQAAVLGSLNLEVVKRAPFEKGEAPQELSLEGETYPWEKIETSQGVIGYVWGKFARSPIDFRANFKKLDGKWMMTFFVAGD